MIAGSRGAKGNVQQVGRRFAVLQTLRNHAKGQGLDLGEGFRPTIAVAQDARQVADLCNPAPVLFALELDEMTPAAFKRATR